MIGLMHHTHGGITYEDIKSMDVQEQKKKDRVLEDEYQGAKPELIKNQRK